MTEEKTSDRRESGGGQEEQRLGGKREGEREGVVGGWGGVVCVRREGGVYIRQGSKTETWTRREKRYTP